MCACAIQVVVLDDLALDRATRPVPERFELRTRVGAPRIGIASVNPVISVTSIFGCALVLTDAQIGLSR